MRTIGLLLIIAGCAGASLVAVMNPPGIVPVEGGGGALTAVLQDARVPWAYFLPLLGLGAVGVVLVRVTMRREATDETRMEANFGELDTRLRTIAERIAKLDADKDDIDVYDLPARIDEQFPREILAFAEARQSIAHAWGARAYADVMSHFAAAERYLNRVWSTAADGYIDEAHTYIGRSREQFAEALARFEALRNRGGQAADGGVPALRREVE